MGRARRARDLAVTADVVEQALADAGMRAGDVAAIGITNQRETTVLWDRATGEPVHRAIVWQDRRSKAVCDRLAADGYGDVGPREDRAGDRSVLLRHESRVAAGECRRPARPGRARRAGVRHHRFLAAVQADRRPRAHHRRHQCLAHAAARHRRGRLGRAAAAAHERAARGAAGGAPELAGLRRDRPGRRSSARAFPSPAPSATSRRRCSPRAASSRARPRTLTAQALSC